MSQPAPRIVVAGSLNVDWIAQVPRLPRPGETIPSTGLIQRFGGKGANQAIAAARQGVATAMVGCVGDDAAGLDYRRHLQREHIDDSGVLTLDDIFTGSAMIAVDDDAENTIIVNAGANSRLTPQHLREQQALVAGAGVLLLQWEIPADTVLEALHLAGRHRVPVVMNPSPLHGDFPWGRHPIHTLIVNAGEADAIFGTDIAADEGKLQSVLPDHGLGHLVITRGSRPTTGLRIGHPPLEVPALKVRPIDTVGAGDAFAGAYAACLARGMDFAASLRYANIAGALATQERGAQEAIPTRERVESAMESDESAV